MGFLPDPLSPLRLEPSVPPDVSHTLPQSNPGPCHSLPHNFSFGHSALNHHHLSSSLHLHLQPFFNILGIQFYDPDNFPLSLSLHHAFPFVFLHLRCYGLSFPAPPSVHCGFLVKPHLWLYPTLHLLCNFTHTLNMA